MSVRGFSGMQAIGTLVSAVFIEEQLQDLGLLCRGVERDADVFLELA